MIDHLVRLILKHSAEQANPSVVNLELLEAAWPSLVGKEMARRTRPRAWSQETLHIEVSSHAWVQELSFHREELLGKIQRTFPWKLSRLHLSVAEDFEPLTTREELETIERAPMPIKKKAASPELNQEAREAMGTFDDELQARMMRIRAHIKSRES